MSLSESTRHENPDALVAALPTGDTIASPYGLYDRLRPFAPCPGYRDYPPGTVQGRDEPVSAWVLLDYAHVSAPTLMLVNHDNPEHDRLRNIVNLAFSRSRVEAMAI